MLFNWLNKKYKQVTIEINKINVYINISIGDIILNAYCTGKEKDAL